MGASVSRGSLRLVGPRPPPVSYTHLCFVGALVLCAISTFHDPSIIITCAVSTSPDIFLPRFPRSCNQRNRLCCTVTRDILRQKLRWQRGSRADCRGSKNRPFHSIGNASGPHTQRMGNSLSLMPYTTSDPLSDKERARFQGLI